jgi:phage gpG-like protein
MLMPTIQFEVLNADRVSFAFGGLGKLVRNWNPIWKLVVNKAIKPWLSGGSSSGGLAFAGQFPTEGATGGHGSWAPLKEDYDLRKRKKYGDKPILQASGDLLEDLTSDSNQGRLSALSMTFGSSLAYAKFHQTGTSKMPARRIIDPDETFKLGIRRQVTRGIVQYIRAYGFAVASSLDIDVSASEAFSIGKSQLGG